MAKEREAVRSEFVKFTRIGQAVAGLVSDYRENDNGPLIELSPVITRAGRGQPFAQFGSVAVGLSTDLRKKISTADVGRLMLIEYKDDEPTTKGSPLKIFRVVELDQKELAQLGLAIDRAALAAGASAAAPAAAAPLPLGAEDEDDLPF